MARRRKGRAIDGVILLDKPPDWSSNGVLQKVRWLFQAQKAGHTGALDPLATGLLPICLGEATKFTRFLLEADKAYRAVARLGERTDTLDAEGVVTEKRAVSELEWAVVERLMAERFTGDIEQIPPMYSALKRDGKKLYELARQGKHVELEPRPVNIFSLKLISLSGPELVLDVHCSKGTYIRTLVDDIGKALGCGAHVTSLRRTRHGQFSLEHSVTLPELIAEQEAGGPASLDHHLLTLDHLLAGLPVVMLSDGQTRRFSHGNPVSDGLKLEPGQYRVKDGASGRFLGVGEVIAGNSLQPLRLMAGSSPN